MTPLTTAREKRDQDQTEEKSLSSVRPKSTAQERRDLDYLEGYGVGLSHTLTHAELVSHTLAFMRGYWDAVDDRRKNEAEVEPA